MAIKNINSQELEKLIKEDKVELVDVREKDEHDLIRIKDSKLIPAIQIRNRLDEIDWTKPVVFYCRTGSRSLAAVKMAMEHGREPMNLVGGIAGCYIDKGFTCLDTKAPEETLRGYFLIF